MDNLQKFKRNPGFTLIELLIAIVLLSIVMTYLYNTVDVLRASNDFFQRRFERQQLQDKAFTALYTDLLFSDSFSITERKDNKYDTLTLHTKNSLYAIPYPNVTYYMSINAGEENRTLYRIEGIGQFRSPLLEEGYKDFRVDEVMSNVEYFKIYKKGSSFLVYLKQKEGRRILFELTPPAYSGAVVTNPDGNGSKSDGNTTSGGASGSALPPTPPGSSAPAQATSPVLPGQPSSGGTGDKPPPPPSSKPSGSSGGGSVLPPPPP